MRSLIIIFFLLLSASTAVQAQTNYDAEKKTWSIAGYAKTIALLFEHTEIKVQDGDQVRSFPIVEHAQIVQLQHASDSQKLLDALQISAAQIESAFSSAPGNGPIEKLLTFVRDNGNKMVLAPLDGALVNADSVVEEGAVAMEEAPKENKLMKWLLPLLGLALGTGLGIAIGRAGRKPAQIIQKETVVQKSTTEPDSDELLALKAAHKKLKADHANLNEKVNAMVKGDTQYYNSVFDKIILPLDDAINKGDEARMAQLLQVAAAQLSSISRTKLRKKLKFDEANLQYIMGNPTSTSAYGSVGKDVPMDKIPAALRNVIAFLQKHGVKDLDDTVILGNKIRNI